MMKKKYILSLLLVLCSCFYLHAQESKIDSLTLALKNTKQDTTKLRLLVQLSEECELNEILTYAIPAVELADAILIEMKNLPVRQKNMILNQKANALNNIGFIYKNHADIKNALEFYSKSLKIQEELLKTTVSSAQLKEVKQGIATSLNNIAIIYNNQADLTKALEYYCKSLKLYEEIDYKKGIAYSLNNIGSIYAQRNDIPKALNYFDRSLKIQEEIDDKEGISNSLTNIGGICKNKGDLLKAFEYYTKSLRLEEIIGNKKGIANSLINIAEIYLSQASLQNSTIEKTKILALSFTFATNSLVYSKELGFPENICNAERLLSKIDSAKRNYKGAYEHCKQLNIYRDSIANQENRKASIKNQLKYEYEKKEAVMNEKQEKEHILAEEKSRKQFYVLLLVSCLLLLVIVFGGFAYRSLKITRKQKIIIEEKQKEILDSIYYARRIQRSLLPTEKYIEKNLSKLRKG